MTASISSGRELTDADLDKPLRQLIEELRAEGVAKAGWSCGVKEEGGPFCFAITTTWRQSERLWKWLMR